MQLCDVEFLQRIELHGRKKGICPTFLSLPYSGGDFGVLKRIKG